MYSNKSAKTKYVFVTGGVASSLGKGIISSSLARLLLARGYSVAIQKMDPYINIDPVRFNKGFYTVTIRFFVKLIFDANGIEIPYQQITVHMDK